MAIQTPNGTDLCVFLKRLKATIEQHSCAQLHTILREAGIEYHNAQDNVVVPIVYSTYKDYKLKTQWVMSKHKTGEMSLKKTTDAEKDGYLETPGQSLINFAILLAKLVPLSQEPLILSRTITRCLLPGGTLEGEHKTPLNEKRVFLSSERGSNKWLVVNPPSRPSCSTQSYTYDYIEESYEAPHFAEGTTLTRPPPLEQVRIFMPKTKPYNAPITAGDYLDYLYYIIFVLDTRRIPNLCAVVPMLGKYKIKYIAEHLYEFDAFVIRVAYAPLTTCVCSPGWLLCGIKRYVSLISIEAPDPAKTNWNILSNKLLALGEQTVILDKETTKSILCMRLRIDFDQDIPASYVDVHHHLRIVEPSA